MTSGPQGKWRPSPAQTKSQQRSRVSGVVKAGSTFKTSSFWWMSCRRCEKWKCVPQHILKPQYTKLKSYTSTTLHLQPIIHSGWWIWSSYFENQPAVFSAEVRHACEVGHEGTPGAEGDKVSLFSEQPACRVLPQRETDTHMRSRGGDSITFLSPWLRQTSSA